MLAFINSVHTYRKTEVCILLAGPNSPLWWMVAQAYYFMQIHERWLSSTAWAITVCRDKQQINNFDWPQSEQKRSHVCLLISLLLVKLSLSLFLCLSAWLFKHEQSWSLFFKWFNKTKLQLSSKANQTTWLSYTKISLPSGPSSKNPQAVLMWIVITLYKYKQGKPNQKEMM